MHFRMCDPLHYYHWLHRWTPLAREERKALEIVQEYSDRIIRERRDELSKRSNMYSQERQDDLDIGLRRKKAFLDILLESTIDGKPLSNLDIREEVDTFMFEVCDAVASPSFDQIFIRSTS